MYKCDTCKDFKYCAGHYTGICYEPSIVKLVIKKIKRVIITKFRLDT